MRDQLVLVGSRVSPSHINSGRTHRRLLLMEHNGGRTHHQLLPTEHHDLECGNNDNVPTSTSCGTAFRYRSTRPLMPSASANVVMQNIQARVVNALSSTFPHQPPLDIRTTIPQLLKTLQGPVLRAILTILITEVIKCGFRYDWKFALSILRESLGLTQSLASNVAGGVTNIVGTAASVAGSATSDIYARLRSLVTSNPDVVQQQLEQMQDELKVTENNELQNEGDASSQNPNPTQTDRTKPPRCGCSFIADPKRPHKHDKVVCDFCTESEYQQKLADELRERSASPAPERAREQDQSRVRTPPNPENAPSAPERPRGQDAHSSSASSSIPQTSLPVSQGSSTLLQRVTPAGLILLKSFVLKYALKYLRYPFQKWKEFVTSINEWWNHRDVREKKHTDHKKPSPNSTNRNKTETSEESSKRNVQSQTPNHNDITPPPPNSHAHHDVPNFPSHHNHTHSLPSSLPARNSHAAQNMPLPHSHHNDGTCARCHRNPCVCTSHSGGPPLPFMFPITPPIPPIPPIPPQTLPYHSGSYNGSAYGYGPGFGFAPNFVFGPGFGINIASPPTVS